MLIGRERELAAVGRLLGDARDGRSGVLLVGGEAGVGKSALLENAIRGARGFRVLRVHGVEGESMLPFAALHALLRPLLGNLDRIPEMQARALGSALALADDGPPDQLAVGAGTLSLLAEAADETPLLVAVDDAHWLDPASADALTFAARRLLAEEIAVLVALRLGASTRLQQAQFKMLKLDPLDEENSLALLLEAAPNLDPGSTNEILTVAQGNPLALVELPLRPRQVERTGRLLTQPPALTERLSEAFLASARSLPEQARRSLLVAAAGDGLDVTMLTRAASTFGGEEHPFAAAEAVGLGNVAGARFEFRHPLVRSAVYQAATSVDRRAAHTAIASVLDREGDVDRRAWQLAMAADGPDELVACALEDAADRAEARGGIAARADALERAAELSENDDARGRRLHAAARAANWAGDPERALGLIDRVLPTVTDPLVRADLVHERHAVTSWQGNPAPVSVLIAEAVRVEHLDTERAAKLLGVAGVVLIDALDTPGVMRIAARIEPLLPQLGPFWAPRTTAVVAEAHLFAGKTQRAEQLYARVLPNADAAATVAVALVWLEWYTEARRVIDISHENGRRSGQTLRVAWTRACLGVLEAALGRFPEALAAAGEALSLGDQMNVEFIQLVALQPLARVAAIQGRHDECRSYAERATGIAEKRRDQHSLCSSRLAIGLLELGEGRHVQVIEQLRPVADLTASGGLADPSVLPYAPDLIEAYVRCGKPAEARTELDHLALQATPTQRPWALAATARCEGLLATEQEYEDLFEEALVRHERVPSPFEQARTQLCYGERLRRSGSRTEARTHLRQALTTFEQLAATPWSNRARNELTATGETVRKRHPTAAQQLTPQELQISLLVTEGRTNKDIAATLYLSPKTVEYHLTHTYRKLNVHSRAELTRLLTNNKPTIHTD